jgi:tyrosyl-DNA phosphodiesterase-1
LLEKCSSCIRTYASMAIVCCCCCCCCCRCRWGGEPAGRQSAMPHIKSYTRYLPPGNSSNDSSSHTQQQQGPAAAGAELAWCVVASHNLSKAAWGSLQKGGSQLMIRR